MSGILLGALAYSGLENQNKSKSIKKRSNIPLDSIYNSNIENNMNRIEKEQIQQKYKKPEFLKQFDELTFDNISGPAAQNDSYLTVTGMNTNLQRDIEFNQGYSRFQQTDMHYDIVDNNNFVHNNMVPSTSRRDFMDNSSRTNRKLETFTGIFSDYVPKTEKTHLFEPIADLSWTNGMPVMTGELQNRFYTTNKNNNGDLPFTNKQYVLRGIDGQNQTGRYSTYRINPKNVDDLRSEINQKVTYLNKPLETHKKGEIRGPDFNITKFKIPDFREQKFEDLVPSRSTIEGPMQTGKYTNVTSMRNEKEFYQPGPANNSNVGAGPNKQMTKFETAKKESYANDPTHAINAVNTKLVMTNIGSYTNYDTQRAFTSHNIVSIFKSCSNWW
jgi:hypothetical protein